MSNAFAALAVLPLYGFISFGSLSAIASISRELEQYSCRTEAAAALLSGAHCHSRAN